MTEDTFYVDNDGDLYDRKTNKLLMLDFGYLDYTYARNVLDKLNEQDKRLTQLEEFNCIVRRLMIKFDLKDLDELEACIEHGHRFKTVV